MKRLVLWLGLALPTVALAQETPSPAPAGPAPAAAAAAPAVSLDEAYKKEFAFLEAQKRELQARITQIRSEFERDRARLSGEISALEARALSAQSQAEALGRELLLAEQQQLNNADNTELLAATFEQARSTLASFGDETLQQSSFAALDDGNRVQGLYVTANAVLQTLSRVRKAPGSFFLADGTEVQGEIIRFGNVAAFGVSAQGSGALAPAGGGRFRLWNAPASAETAQALAAGQSPAVLRAFLYENVNAAVAEPEVKTVWKEVKKGGLIGYIILALGAVAMLLVVLRAVFLQQAGASIGAILDAITPAVKAHRIDDAIAAAKRFKGSAARVVTAALRNVDRDREHLEDIVSESILHESTHLSRFGSVITMIAAVAPLLGLLGTVTGMIQTFDVITEFGTSDPKLLSGGIATALVTTELGLIVAIPCLLLGNLLGGWADRIKDDMEKAALRAINLYQDVRSAA
jgi:biopolymer transport protein ExbB